MIAMRGILLACLLALSVMLHTATLSDALRLPMPFRNPPSVSFSGRLERMSNKGDSDSDAMMLMMSPPPQEQGSLGEAYMNNEALTVINKGILTRRLRGGEGRSLSTTQPPLSPQQAVLHPDYVCANTC